MTAVTGQAGGMATPAEPQGGDGPQPRSARRVAALAIFGAVMVPALAALSAWQARQQAFEQGVFEAQRAARILKEHADRVIGGHFTALQQFETQLRETRWEFDSRGLHDRMRAVVSDRPEVQSIWLFDETGEIRNASVGYPPPRGNLFDRDYFQAALRGDDRTISRVVVGRVTGEPNFSLVRRLADPQGRFLGVLVLSIQPQDFQRFYAEIAASADVGKLARTDGALLARHPPPQDWAKGPELAPAMLSRISAGAGSPAGVLSDDRHIYGFRRLDALPLVVLYGVAVDGIRAEWMRQMRTSALLAVPALLGMVALGWTAHRQALAADRSREELRLANLTLERRVGERTEELRRSEAHSRTLAQEMDHRARNLLATVQSIVRLSRAETADQYAKQLAGRVAALSHAHVLLSESRWSSASLRKLAEEEFAAYGTGPEGRVSISGADVALAPQAAQYASMLLHELATNAAKYGALSSPRGRVSLQLGRRGDDRLTLRWVETGGPAPEPPSRKGFGTRLIGFICSQLGAEIAFDWRPGGLAIEIAAPLARLVGEEASEAARAEAARA